ncbi:MAG: RidA family protein [Verrucomicrobia bacterium]|nr:RidA family protein [Verrucomicrobiota bacterium]
MRLHHESNPDTLATPDGHFSQCTAVPAGASYLFISGQVPRDAQGRTVGVGDMTRQAEQVFANLQAALAAHGATFAHVVKATLFVTRMDLAGEVVAVRRRFYGDSKPASTFVGVTALNDPDWWLEVELVAVLPGTAPASAA